MKGFTIKGFIFFVIVAGIGIFLIMTFTKGFSKSAEKTAEDSANAIYNRANTYYVNTMMLIGQDTYRCEFKKDGCSELDFVSTTKPNDGVIDINKGRINAILKYNDINYYICSNKVTNNEQCLIEQSRNITLEDINNYYINNYNDKFNGYECDFDKKNCKDEFTNFFDLNGKLIIKKNGKIEASLKIKNYDYYICNNKIELNSDCLIDESIDTIINSSNEYYKSNNESYYCDFNNCKIDFKTLTIPTGNINILEDGKINGTLNYNNKTYYICDGKKSDKKC